MISLVPLFYAWRTIRSQSPGKLVRFQKVGLHIVVCYGTTSYPARVQTIFFFLPLTWDKRPSLYSVRHWDMYSQSLQRWVEAMLGKNTLLSCSSRNEWWTPQMSSLLFFLPSSFSSSLLCQCRSKKTLHVGNVLGECAWLLPNLSARLVIQNGKNQIPYLATFI